MKEEEGGENIKQVKSDNGINTSMKEKVGDVKEAKVGKWVILKRVVKISVEEKLKK